jgi:uncharacterized protein (TIGR02266 family)
LRALVLARDRSRRKRNPPRIRPPEGTPRRRTGPLQFRSHPVERSGLQGAGALRNADKQEQSFMNTPGAKVAENIQNVRAAERFDLEVKVDLESEHNFYTGLTQNISSGGLFIATHHIRKIGDRITLNFTLPGAAKPVLVETEVRWIRENSALMRANGDIGMGVRFINLTPEAKQAIDAFVQSRESLYYDDED